MLYTLKLNRKFIFKHLGDDLLIRIAPAKVDYHAGSKWQSADFIRYYLDYLPSSLRYRGRKSLRRIHKYESFFYDDKLFQTRTHIQDTYKYKKTNSAIKAFHKINFTDCFWYHELIKELQTNGIAIHKNIKMYKKEEVDYFFNNYVFKLIESFLKNGFVDSISNEYGTCVIDGDKKVLKSSSAVHRFCMAKDLGISSFPLQVIGISKSVYYSEIKQKTIKETLLKLKEFIKEVEQAHSASVGCIKTPPLTPSAGAPAP